MSIVIVIVTVHIWFHSDYWQVFLYSSETSDIQTRLYVSRTWQQDNKQYKHNVQHISKASALQSTRFQRVPDYDPLTMENWSSHAHALSVLVPEASVFPPPQCGTVCLTVWRARTPHGNSSSDCWKLSCLSAHILVGGACEKSDFNRRCINVQFDWFDWYGRIQRSSRMW